MCLADFGGDWKRYEEALYEAYLRDFSQANLTYEGLPLGVKRHPKLDGKDATFVHFTSEGRVESARTPDLRRCERICWPRPIIELAGRDDAIKVWENDRGREKRACLWLEEEDYLVVLALRGTYVLPWTAYLVQEEHGKRKLRKEYLAFKKSWKG